MNAEELSQILDLHKKWLTNEDGGQRANLSDANLSGANLSGADLRRANLQLNVNSLRSLDQDSVKAELE